MKQVVGRMRTGCVKNGSRVEVIPELDRKDILARQRADAVAVGGEVKEHQGWTTTGLQSKVQGRD